MNNFVTSPLLAGLDSHWIGNEEAPVSVSEEVAPVADRSIQAEDALLLSPSS